MHIQTTKPSRSFAVPPFSGPWLARQIAKLAAEFSNYTIRCDFAPIPIDFDIEEIDLAIRYGPGEYPDTIAELLHTDKWIPVCTPATAKRINRPVIKRLRVLLKDSVKERFNALV